LLFSHLSENHTVFSLDAGDGSVRNVRRSPLLREDTVTFVEGPTQTTLPSHSFQHKLNAVLIDGPHAYPFPDLEYYYFYPHLVAGALLILDDIHIRSIHNLFSFLCKDAMFELTEVADTPAFFRRNETPTFDPFGDGWWAQNYNASPLLRYTWKQRVRSMLVPGLRRLERIQRRGGRRSAVRITAPESGATVGETGEVEGSATLPDGSHLWVLVHRKDLGTWWPQAGGAASVADGRWRVAVKYGEPRDAGFQFEIAAVVVPDTVHKSWIASAESSGGTLAFPSVRFPHSGDIIDESSRTVKKRQ